MIADERRTYVLDTNVLMHDPTALFRFREHDVFIPMVVLEELDAAKKGLSEVARNVRQVSRFLDELMAEADAEAIADGLSLDRVRFPGDNGESAETAPPGSGRMFFQTWPTPSEPGIDLPGNKPDTSILATVLELQRRNPDTAVTLVSKDINLRIKASVIGIHAEDYHSDRVVEDADLLFGGTEALAPDFWGRHGGDLRSWQEDGRTFYSFQGADVAHWYPNQCVYIEGDQGPDAQEFQAIVRQVEGDCATVELLRDHREQHPVWGISARNREQAFALNLLMDPQIDFVTLLGVAGTGKTLLTLAAGLAQSLDISRYAELIVTRVTIPVGEDIGFLPGTEEEKMTPWMGALMDNLEVLATPGQGGEWGRAATNDVLLNRIKIRSLNFMRGRTFLNRFVIIDEAQNLTPKQMKTLITRAGPGTKIVCLGNIAQIDTPYLTQSTSGLTYVVDRFRHWRHSGHVTLRRGERSRLAEFASENL